MKYCVVRGTTKVIDGSDNPEEIMIANAQNAGVTDFEILTEEEYQARKALEPVEPQPKTELDQVKEDNAKLNLQYIDLFELLLAQGVI